MWFLLLLIHAAHTQLTDKKDGDGVILRGGASPCEGHVEVLFEGKWRFVGDKYWTSNTEKVACRSTHCGEPLPDSTVDVERPKKSEVWLNELKCRGDEEQLWQCDCPGWNISYYSKPSVKKIKCSNKIDIRLDGYKCAGAVQYSTDGGQKWSGYFCADKLENKEADFLCKSQGCGKSKELQMHDWMIWDGFKSNAKKKINCSDISPIDNLWQCITKESNPQCKNPVSVVCNGYERLQLRGNASNVCSGRLEKEKNGKWNPVKNNASVADQWCRQMHCGASNPSSDANGTQLTCTDRVNVVLMDGRTPSKCYGAVHIDVNGERLPVCGSSWTMKEAEVVCKELNCGKVIKHSNDQKTNERGAMNNVKCLGSESSLWHCRAKRNSSAVKCSEKASVICADSIRVRLKDGPGRCAGRVEIQYEGQWRQVSKNQWDDKSDTVCKELNCGNKSKTETFMKGPDNFLANTVKCKSDASTISDCLTNSESNTAPSQRETVGITCEEHEVVFLSRDESSPCSGRVGIEHNSNNYWLSGSNKTWNRDSANIVCQQKNCGTVSNFTSVPSTDKQAKFWDKSYKCSSNGKSLFECETKTPSSDHNETIARVTCTGTITMSLTKTCWGHVIINMNGRSGGVCGDSWTQEHSEMLCKSRGCGDHVLKAINQAENIDVLVKSLHNTDLTNDLTRSNFVLNDEKDNTCNRNPAYVICSGSVEPRFSSNRDKCVGNVEVFYEGKWLPVCESALKNVDVRHTICGQLGCDRAVDVIPHFGPKPTESNVISQLQCNGTKSLSECIITSNQDKSCKPVGLNCTGWRKMLVNGTCSGPVSVLSNGKHHAVSSEGWTANEGKTLCQDLNCGSYKSKEDVNSTNKDFWNRNFKCSDGPAPENIWKCENNETLDSREKKQLFIKCEESEVTLTDHCQGEVKMNKLKVCSSGWIENYSHMICQEKNCSNAFSREGSFNEPEPNTEYNHVRCTSNQHRLSQCMAMKGKCDGKVVTVACVENFKFNTSRHCGGELKVYDGRGWEKVCPLEALSQDSLNMLCSKLGCSGYISKKLIIKNKYERLKVGLNCTTKHMDIKHCVVAQTCTAKPAEIYCGDYIPPPTTPPPPKSTNVPVIVGVVLSLVVLILIIVFVRICIIKKYKNDKNIRSTMLSRNDLEFESGEYEDVPSKENEMEEFGRGRLRSEAEFITENDARSTSSFSYDDIDEAEAEPLRSHATTAGASRDNNIQQDTLNQSDGKFQSHHAIPSH
ncbi:scavenger receptor cysteine-rich type 1 protein M160 [Seriola aureovittata]|uniref:scavenger receptor cysteine-rich type 1 protein M160 n=1 Tax=Seriola aureovittata TaxID=2871759 RepID=UPI0024BE8498|nr:scavenger receptor cysteine-rich type 1 protein M160 [Seriola aureovittata]